MKKKYLIFLISLTFSFYADSDSEINESIGFFEDLTCDEFFGFSCSKVDTQIYANQNFFITALVEFENNLKINNIADNIIKDCSRINLKKEMALYCKIFQIEKLSYEGVLYPSENDEYLNIERNLENIISYIESPYFQIYILDFIFSYFSDDIELNEII